MFLLATKLFRKKTKRPLSGLSLLSMIVGKIQKYHNSIVVSKKMKKALTGGMESYILYNGISFSELIKIKSLTHLTKMKIIVVRCINVIDFLSHFPDQS